MLLAVLALALAADPTSHVVNPTLGELQTIQAEHADAIELAKLNIERSKRGALDARQKPVRQVKGKLTWRQAEDKKKQAIATYERNLAVYTERLAALRAGAPPRGDPLFRAENSGRDLIVPVVGAIGRFGSSLPVEVEDVQGADELLVRVGKFPAEISVLARVPTAGLVDGVAVGFADERWFRVSGTRKVFGVRTVLYLEELDPAKIRAFLAQAAAP